MKSSIHNKGIVHENIVNESIVNKTIVNENIVNESIINELKDKYDVVEIINKRYDGDENIINFYNQYYNEIEKIEKIGFEIWKIFSDMWKEEKQEYILEILKMSLFIERNVLNIKKKLLELNLKNNYQNNHKIQEDKRYLLKLIDKTSNTHTIYIPINSNYEDLCEKYMKSREDFKMTIEEEFKRLNSTEKK